MHSPHSTVAFHLVSPQSGHCAVLHIHIHPFFHAFHISINLLTESNVWLTVLPHVVVWGGNMFKCNGRPGGWWTRLHCHHRAKVASRWFVVPSVCNFIRWRLRISSIARQQLAPPPTAPLQPPMTSSLLLTTNHSCSSDTPQGWFVRGGVILWVAMTRQASPQKVSPH